MHWPAFIQSYAVLWVSEVETVRCEVDFEIHLSTLQSLMEFGHHSEMSDHSTSNCYYRESGPIHQGKFTALLRWVKRGGGVQTFFSVTKWFDPPPRMLLMYECCFLESSETL